MTRILLLILTALLLNVISTQAIPPNDDCSTAVILIVGGGCVNGDITGATTEGMPLPSCWGNTASNYSNSVWYKFVATDDSISINIGDGTWGTTWLNTKTLTAVYSGNCGSLTEIGCAKSGNETLLTGLIIGSTYYIMLDGYGTSVGTFCISVYETPTPPPTIGTCSNPRDLFVGGDCNNLSGGVNFDTQDNMLWTNTTTGADEGVSAAGYGNPQAVDGPTHGPDCTDNDANQNAYWVRFTATEATQVFTNSGAGKLDYCLFTGTCGALTSFDCYSVAGGASCTIGTGGSPTLTPGTSYLVMITNGIGNASSRRYLCITSTTIAPCQYDACSTAFPVTAGVAYTLDNANCTPDFQLCSGTTENNIWLNWTCPADWVGAAYLHLYNEDCVGAHGMQMSIYSAGVGCVNNNTNCILTVNPNNNNDFYGTFVPSPGSTYIIDLDGYGGCGCQFNFVIDNDVVLPIELVSFTADVVGSIVSLNWITASEMNNNYFSIERSDDGVNFDVIDKVDAVGNSASAVAYSVRDENPFQGTSYYRLKQTNFNGAFQYSKTITVHLKSASSSADIYPNPAFAENQIHILFNYLTDEDRVTIEIRDEVGILRNQILTTVKLGVNDIIIPTGDLALGLYNIFIKGSQQQINSVFVITK